MALAATALALAAQASLKALTVTMLTVLHLAKTSALTVNPLVTMLVVTAPTIKSALAWGVGLVGMGRWVGAAAARGPGSCCRALK